MKIINSIPANIFRGYDIRGLVDVEINQDTAYTLGKAYASYQRVNERQTEVIVGYDNRESSPSLANALIKGLTEAGAKVLNIGMCTTPISYFAWEKLNTPAGIMITASHNGKEYNGFKFSFDESGSAYGEKIQQFRRFIEEGNFIDAVGSVQKVDVLEEYIHEIKENIKLGNRKIKVVVDSGNGAATLIIHRLFDLFKEELEVIHICDTNDSSYPNHHPDPSEEKNLAMLKEMVRKTNADVGLAFDGDADRCGVVDNLCNSLPVDYLLVIFLRNMIDKMKNKRVLFDVKCSNVLSDEIEKLGGIPFRYRTGSSYIKAKQKEEKIELAGELSGHVFFLDKWYGFDDGIYTGLRLLEILTNSDKKCSQLLENISQYVQTEERRIETTDTKKYEIVEKIKKYCDEKGYQYTTIDGVRIEFKDGWVLVRCSQTGPKVTYRMEAKTKERLNELIKEFECLLKNEE